MSNLDEFNRNGNPIGLLIHSTVPFFEQQESFPKVPYCKVLSDRLVLYTLPDSSYGKKRVSLKSIGNLIKKGHTGRISKQSCSRIRQILDTWLSSLIHHIPNSDEKLNGRFYYPVFITVTLTAKQNHDDKFINRHILTRFLEKLVRYSGTRNFFWRAESQKNGNIHYHIIIDRFVNHTHVRKMWNDTLENFGYLDEFEKKHGHRNPNSTDVKGVKDVKNFIDYVLKYVCKQEKFRTLNCRLWGCSDSVRELKPFVVEIDSEISEELGIMKKERGTHVIKAEFIDIMLFNIKKAPKIKSTKLFTSYRKYLYSIYKQLYTGFEKLPEALEQITASVKEPTSKEQAIQLYLFDSFTLKSLENIDVTDYFA